MINIFHILKNKIINLDEKEQWIIIVALGACFSILSDRIIVDNIYPKLPFMPHYIIQKSTTGVDIIDFIYNHDKYINIINKAYTYNLATDYLISIILGLSMGALLKDRIVLGVFITILPLVFYKLMPLLLSSIMGHSFWNSIISTDISSNSLNSVIYITSFILVAIISSIFTQYIRNHIQYGTSTLLMPVTEITRKIKNKGRK